METFFPPLALRKRRHSFRQGASTSQDEAEQPPRSRLRGAARIASRTSSSSVEIVDVTPQAGAPAAEDEPIDLSVSVCLVDLTEENDATVNRNHRNAAQEDVVDLTDVPDTQAERTLPRRRRRRGRRRLSSQRIIPILSDDSDEENDIMVLPEIDICNSHRAEREAEEETNGTGVATRGRHNSSPHKRAITCPICMEDERTIRNSGQQLMSTNCGHVFCRNCIRASIQTQHRCPSCRKKLTMRQIHPIFL